jgi:hypothetical protein
MASRAEADGQPPLARPAVGKRQALAVRFGEVAAERQRRKAPERPGTTRRFGLTITAFGAPTAPLTLLC